MEMLKPDSVFTFGKYKGKTVFQVFELQPSYLCWMRKTGFSNFGKDVTEAIFAWEELNPKEVQKVERGIVKARFDKNTSSKAVKEETRSVAEIVTSKVSNALSDPLFGSW